MAYLGSVRRATRVGCHGDFSVLPGSPDSFHPAQYKPLSVDRQLGPDTFRVGQEFGDPTGGPWDQQVVKPGDPGCRKGLESVSNPLRSGG